MPTVITRPIDASAYFAPGSSSRAYASGLALHGRPGRRGGRPRSSSRRRRDRRSAARSRTPSGAPCRSCCSSCTVSASKRVQRQTSASSGPSGGALLISPPPGRRWRATYQTPSAVSADANEQRDQHLQAPSASPLSTRVISVFCASAGTQRCHGASPPRSNRLTSGSSDTARTTIVELACASLKRRAADRHGHQQRRRAPPRTAAAAADEEQRLARPVLEHRRERVAAQHPLARAGS